jgi:photosystem II stability/assembly factor-like uncharacterized protein
VYRPVPASSHTRRRGSTAGRAIALALLIAAPAHATTHATIIKDNLYGVKMVSADRVWMVGNFGSIFTSGDGGKTWETRDGGTKSPLFAVDFADERHGWIVGKASLILHTDDGGATWATQQSPIGREKPLFGVRAIDARTAWAVGDWGAMLVTRDGGATWEDRTFPEDLVLNDVSFPDPQHGYVCGEFGTMLVTADGGGTWEKRNVGADKTLFGVSFSSPLTGWAVGMDGLIVRTTDGGATWTVQRGRASEGSLEDLGFMDTLKNPGFYQVSVAGRYGVVVGDTGNLLTSSDGGETWTPHELPTRERLVWMRGASVVADNAGFVVGANGFSASVEDGRVERRSGRGERAEETD